MTGSRQDGVLEPLDGTSRAELGLQQLAAIVAASDDAIVGRTLDGLVTSWNPGAERLFGYAAAEIVGRSVDALIPADTELDVAGLRASVNRGEGQKIVDTRLVRKDGSDVHVSLASSPIVDGAGGVVGVALVIRDITERHQLEGQLRQAQKMEAIGSLAGGVAHDFNNLLTVIRTSSELMRRDVTHETLSQRLREIDAAVEHGAALTRQLLAFSRQQILRPEPTDLNAVVRPTLELVERVIGEQIRLERQLGAQLGLTNVDRGQLQQVVLNLCVNARDAMPDGGTLIVETANVVLDETYAAEHVDVAPGKYVLLEVGDSGIGMTADTVERIFDPFFTTKEFGTGLGLATVYGVVKQSGGHIWVYSEPGFGTSFKIYLPLSNDAASPSDAATPVDGVVQGDETVLLVEDAEFLRPLMAEVLAGYGYDVLVAANGPEALLVADNAGRPIDVLLTDVVMPHMNGRELAERLTARYPEIKVLFSSGYHADILNREGIETREIAFIQKPYLADDLARAIRALLDRESV